MWLISFSAIPLGVPGEWVWSRAPVNGGNAWRFFVIAAGFACYLGVVQLTDRAITRGRYVGAWMAVSLLAAGVWQACLSTTLPMSSEARAAFVLYDVGTSGYFRDANAMAEDWPAFCRGYEKRIIETDGPDRYLHQGTHPPGLVLCLRGLLGASRSWPWFRDVMLATEPVNFHDACQVLRTSAPRPGERFGQEEEATLWAAALLVQLAILFTTIPIYRLACRYHPPTASWRMAAFWPLIPAPLIFFPKSDTVFPLLATVACECWLRGLDRRSLVLCLVAGSVFLFGMTLSLALAPLMVLLTIQTLYEWFLADTAATDQFPNRFRCRAVLSGAVGFFVPCLLLANWPGMNLLQIWRSNFANHAEFYQHFSRTWWKWWLENPIELALAAGLPLMVLILFRRPSLPQDTGASCRTVSARAATWSFVFILSLLWIWGKNQGEAARLWIVFLPNVLALTTPLWTDKDCDRVWWSCLILQAIACANAVATVQGFDFGQ